MILPGLVAAFLAAFAGPVWAEENWNVLAVTASSGDYIDGAGGTLAKLALDGYHVYVAQFGNDEKVSAGLGPGETRRANLAEAGQAAEFLGFRDTVHMAHKSGELGYIPSTEMRQQLFALIRHLRPRKIFIPDPYVHYQDDWDIYWTGKMAEEAWGYSGAATFATELPRMSLRPYAAPEVYYYAVGRPYRPGEGGEKNARLLGVDIGATFQAKLTAVRMLRTRNRRHAQACAEDLARFIGARHGYQHGEEFNYVGPGPAIPPHVRERAAPK